MSLFSRRPAEEVERVMAKALALANRLAYVELFTVLELTPERLDASLRVLPPPFTARILSTDEVHGYAADEATGLGRAFVQDSLAHGDVCVAIFDGDRLANYGWYSTAPTRTITELEVRIAEGRLYGHHDYTLPTFRGRRLHGLNKAWALEHLCGGRPLVALVAGDNLTSMHSMRRMGHVVLGRIAVVGKLGRFYVHADAGCRAAGISLGPRLPNVRTTIIPALRPTPVRKLTAVRPASEPARASRVP